MRLTATVQVYNRSLPSLNVPQKKSERSFLTLGRLPGKDISILHQTQKDRSGSMFKVHNITTLYVKFLKEGKASISFKEPPVDLRIQANAVDLNKFIMMLKSFIDKTELPKGIGKLSNLAAATEKVPPAPKTKLVINSSNELPFKTGYPRSLQTLVINNCRSSKLDNRILRLQNLVVLNLELNAIEYIPEQIDLLPNLRELYLSDNKLGIANKWKWLDGKCLQKNITHLEMKNNSLMFLPVQIGHFKNLRVLNITDNKISLLPNLFGKLSKLKELYIANNTLKYLPGSFQLLRLDTIDISHNKICPSIRIHANPIKHDVVSPPSLIDLAGRHVLNARINLSEEILPRDLILYLESASYCICLKPTFPLQPEVFTSFPLKKVANMVTHRLIQANFPMAIRYCGNKCFQTALQRTRHMCCLIRNVV